MALYAQMRKHVKSMSKEELLTYFPQTVKNGKVENDFTNAYLMRSIIMNEREFGRTSYDRTLRGMWYSSVKPTLDKLGLLDAKDMEEEALTKWDATLSKYLADLLRLGLLTYKELKINDTSRQKANPYNYFRTEDVETFGYQITTALYPNIIIATEKDTVYGIIKDIADIFGFSCISCKGQNSLGAMEGLVRGMRYGKHDWQNHFDTIYIFTMTDYDPAGYYIADALEGQVIDICKALKIPVSVEINRIGITPSQLDYDMVEANKYTPKPANMDKWMEKTGGINGEPKGLELDALDPSQIREIFVDNIRPYVDEEHYSSFIKESYIKQKVLESITQLIGRITEEITDKIKEDIEVKEFDIFENAKAGQREIPIKGMCNDDKDEEIKSMALGYFNIE